MMSPEELEPRDIFEKIVSGEATEEEVRSLDGMESYNIPSEKEMNEFSDEENESPEV